MNFKSGLRTLLLLSLGFLSACNSDITRFIDAAKAAELEIQSVELTPETAILDSGETQPMKFEATLADGSRFDLTNQAEWRSDDTAIASVDGKGLVTAGRQTGTTLIHARFAEFNGQSSIQVSNANLVSLEISGGDQADICKPLQLELTGHFDDGSTRSITGKGETWSVTPTGEATISSAGKLTVSGAKTATVEVNVSKDNVTTRQTVTVNHSLTGIIVAKQADPIEVGNNATLQATGQYQGGGSSDITTVASWSSTDPTVATADPGGKVTALSVGTATVRATCGGVAGNALVTVIQQATVQAVEIENGDAEITVNQDDKLSLTLAAIDNLGKRTTVTEDAEWSAQQLSGGPITVSNKSGSKGEVDTRNAGKALVTATYKGHSASIQVIVEGTATTNPTFP